MSVFYSKYHQPVRFVLGEINSRENCKVDAKGYIPLDVQIERLLYAGDRLEQSRREQFDFTVDESDPGFLPPCLGDAYGSVVLSDLRTKYRKSLYEKAAKAKAKNEPAKNEPAKDEPDATAD